MKHWKYSGKKISIHNHGASSKVVHHISNEGLIIPGKIFVVDVVRNLDARDVDLGGCSQQEPLVDPRKQKRSVP